jgi:hypothetical protein
MPRPFNERQALEKERSELPGQIAAYRQELADTPTIPEFKARRERMEWQIREREKRLVAVTARLAALPTERD